MCLHVVMSLRGNLSEKRGTTRYLSKREWRQFENEYIPNNNSFLQYMMRLKQLNAFTVPYQVESDKTANLSSRSAKQGNLVFPDEFYDMCSLRPFQFSTYYYIIYETLCPPTENKGSIFNFSLCDDFEAKQQDNLVTYCQTLRQYERASLDNAIVDFREHVEEDFLTCNLIVVPYMVTTDNTSTNTYVMYDYMTKGCKISLCIVLFIDIATAFFVTTTNLMVLYASSTYASLKSAYG